MSISTQPQLCAVCCHAWRSVKPLNPLIRALGQAGPITPAQYNDGILAATLLPLQSLSAQGGTRAIVRLSSKHLSFQRDSKKTWNVSSWVNTETKSYLLMEIHYGAVFRFKDLKVLKYDLIL